jgi:catechol 2,3-dioxygenase-like lactoylglutathione lyase family enzyme
MAAIVLTQNQVRRIQMQVVDKLMMFSMAVSDMPKAKAFYADTLGLKVTTDYRQDDDNWWVTLTLPEGGVSITLARAHAYGYHESIKPGMVGVYLATSDVAAAHSELSKKGAKVSDIQDDLFGPGSGVKFFTLEDPDGAQVLLVQS